MTCDIRVTSDWYVGSMAEIDAQAKDVGIVVCNKRLHQYLESSADFKYKDLELFSEVEATSISNLIENLSNKYLVVIIGCTGQETISDLLTVNMCLQDLGIQTILILNSLPRDIGVDTSRKALIKRVILYGKL